MRWSRLGFEPRHSTFVGHDFNAFGYARAIFPLLLIVFSLTLLSSCGSGKEAEGTTPTLPEATKTTAPECQTGEDGGSAISEACQDVLFVSAVRESDYPALDDLEDKKIVGFVRGLCAYGSTMAGKDPTEMPLFGDLLASTSNSWGVSVEAVEAIYDASQMLCPEAYELMSKMPRADGGLQLELRATGEGSAKVSYLLPHGAIHEEESVDLPWTQRLYVPEAMSLSITVTPIDGSKVGCQIAYSGTILDEERVADEMATCDALSKDVDRVIAENMNGGHDGRRTGDSESVPERGEEEGGD